MLGSEGEHLVSARSAVPGQNAIKSDTGSAARGGTAGGSGGTAGAGAGPVVPGVLAVPGM